VQCSRWVSAGHHRAFASGEKKRLAMGDGLIRDTLEHGKVRHEADGP
jgi:hypothetical protein